MQVQVQVQMQMQMQYLSEEPQDPSVPRHPGRHSLQLFGKQLQLLHHQVVLRVGSPGANLEY